VPSSLQGVAFNLAAEWLFRTSNHTLIGVRNGRGAIELNPARRLLQSGDVCGHHFFSLVKSFSSPH